MGKSEPTPQRFRRKAKAQGTSSNTSEQIFSSLISPHSTVDNLLCNNLLDSNNASELTVSSPEQTSELSQSLAAANGTCDTELNDTDTKGCNPVVDRDDCVVAADPDPHEDPDRTKEMYLDSYLPAELSGLLHSEISPLCTNQSLNLSACHVQREDSLVFVVFIMNSSDSVIQQMLFQVSSEDLEVNSSVENDQWSHLGSTSLS